MPSLRAGGWKDRLAVLGLALLFYSTAAMLYSHIAHAQAMPVKAGQPVQDAWFQECDILAASGRCNWACFLSAADYEWVSDMCAVAGLVPNGLSPPQAMIVGLTAKRLCKSWMDRNFASCVRLGCIPQSPVVYRWHPEDDPILVDRNEPIECGQADSCHALQRPEGE